MSINGKHYWIGFKTEQNQYGTVSIRMATIELREYQSAHLSSKSTELRNWLPQLYFRLHLISNPSTLESINYVSLSYKVFGATVFWLNALVPYWHINKILSNTRLQWKGGIYFQASNIKRWLISQRYIEFYSTSCDFNVKNGERLINDILYSSSSATNQNWNNFEKFSMALLSSSVLVSAKHIFGEAESISTKTFLVTLQ